MVKLKMAVTSSIPPSQVSIQLAKPSDAAAIAAIGRETFRFSFGHSMAPEDMQAYLDSTYLPHLISGELSDTSTNIFLVARQAQHHDSNNAPQDDDGFVVGFCQMKRGTTEPFLPADVPLIELYRIYMQHTSNGRGTGKLLMERADEFGKREGCEGIWLGVWEENLRAQRFYEKCGYKHVGYHDFVMGNEVQRDHVLLKMF